MEEKKVGAIAVSTFDCIHNNLQLISDVNSTYRYVLVVLVNVIFRLVECGSSVDGNIYKSTVRAVYLPVANAPVTEPFTLEQQTQLRIIGRPELPPGTLVPEGLLF